jgi:hypothetical protein
LRIEAKSELIHINVDQYFEIFELCAARQNSFVDLLGRGGLAVAGAEDLCCTRVQMMSVASSSFPLSGLVAGRPKMLSMPFHRIASSPRAGHSARYRGT